jgi:hypothetical protein
VLLIKGWIEAMALWSGHSKRSMLDIALIGHLYFYRCEDQRSNTIKVTCLEEIGLRLRIFINYSILDSEYIQVGGHIHFQLS